MSVLLASNNNDHGSPTLLNLVTITKYAVAFSLPNRATIDRVDYTLSKVGSPTGNAYARIYNLTDTYGVNAVPLGNPIAESDPFDVTTIGAEGWYSFLFSTPAALPSATPYFISVEHVGTASNRVTVQLDTDETIYAGNTAGYTGTWSYLIGGSEYDLYFFLYGNLILPSIQGVQSITGVQSIRF